MGGEMTISERLARYVMRHRWFFGIAVLLVTAAFATQIPKVRMESPLIDLFPENHEFVETYVAYQDIFGGANTVILVLEVVEGDIFNTPTLEKIRALTKELELLPAINNYQVMSLAQRKVKNITVDAVEGFQAVPVMWPDIPQTPEEIDALKKLVHSSPQIHGSLVSMDDKAALILAGFFEDQLNVKEMYAQMHALQDKLEDGNTKIRMIGRPMMLGFILENYSQLTWLFIATVLAMILLLAINFRDVRGVMIPTLTAVLSAIWALGFIGMVGINFDPLIMVVPFIISARALSHSVQLIERYNEEYVVARDKSIAAEKTLAGLWEPGFVGILADVLAMLAVLLTPIPLMQKLSIMGAFWGISIVATDLIFNPVLLSFLPPPKRAPSAEWGPLARFLAAVGRFTIGPRKWTILAGTVVLGIGGFLAARTVQIGDVYPGTPMLWPDSQYNLDTESISQRFGNTDIMNVIVEGDEWNVIKDPDVLRKIWFLQREVETIDEVSGTSSIVDLLPRIVQAMHGGEPRWQHIPEEAREAGFFLEMIYGASEPGDLSRYVTPDSRHANIAIYLKDHKGTTLMKVVEKLRAYVGENTMEKARFRLAGGFAGLLAAVNEVVMRTEAQVTIMAFFVVFLVCAIAYRSILAGLFFMIPLVVSNYLTYALMGLRGIGLDVNTVPIVALGVGLGVDYGLYVVSRIEEEFRVRGDLGEAIVTSMATSGKAVVVTAMTMVAGVVFWTFSFLRFQADMGLLLVFWMSMSMVGSLLLLPTLIWLFRPKFVVGAKHAVKAA